MEEHCQNTTEIQEEKKEMSISEQVIQKRYDAILFLDFNKPVEGMRLFKEALDLDRDNADSHNELGLLYGRLHNIEEACYSFREALLKNATYYTYFSYALVLEKLGNYEEAIEMYTRAIECCDDIYFTAKSYIAIAEICMKLQKSKEEIELLYLEAIAVAPEYFSSYYYKALFHVYHMEYDTALPNALRVVELNTYAPKGYYLLSSIYARKEEWEVSLEYAQKAVLLSEEHPVYMQWLTALENVHMYYTLYISNKECIKELLEALNAIHGYSTMQSIVAEYVADMENSEDITVEYSLSTTIGVYTAYAYIALYYGLYDDALYWVQENKKLSEISSEKKALQLLEIKIYQEKGEYFSCIEIYYSLYMECVEKSTKIIEKYNNTNKVQEDASTEDSIESKRRYEVVINEVKQEQRLYARSIGEMYIHNAMYAEASEWLYLAIDSTKKDIHLLYLYAYALYNNNMVKEVLDLCVHIREVGIDDEVIFSHCVEMLYSLHTYRECIRYCELWKQYNPSNYRCYYYLALARYARGYTNDAVEVIREAVLLSPNNTECKELLQAMEYALIAIENTEE